MEENKNIRGVDVSSPVKSSKVAIGVSIAIVIAIGAGVFAMNKISAEAEKGVAKAMKEKEISYEKISCSLSSNPECTITNASAENGSITAKVIKLRNVADIAKLSKAQGDMKDLSLLKNIDVKIEIQDFKVDGQSTVWNDKNQKKLRLAYGKESIPQLKEYLDHPITVSFSMQNKAVNGVVDSKAKMKVYSKNYAVAVKLGTTIGFKDDKLNMKEVVINSLESNMKANGDFVNFLIYAAYLKDMKQHKHIGETAISMANQKLGIESSEVAGADVFKVAMIKKFRETIAKSEKPLIKEALTKFVNGLESNVDVTIVIENPKKRSIQEAGMIVMNAFGKQDPSLLQDMEVKVK